MWIDAESVVREIRERLRLPPNDLAQEDQQRFDETLATALHAAVFSNRVAADALARAGQAGRLSPSLYTVEQPERFRNTFYRHGLKKRNIEDAVLRPDDFQHLMTKDAVDRDVISLFMRTMLPSGRDRHWLLVQTHRRNLEQVVQSAWRVYIDDVDLSKASSPLDVLKAFVDVYGTSVKIADRPSTKFIESESFKGDFNMRDFEFMFQSPPSGKWFASVSHANTRTPGSYNVGIGYCIDFEKYETALQDHGIAIARP